MKNLKYFTFRKTKLGTIRYLISRENSSTYIIKLRDDKSEFQIIHYSDSIKSAVDCVNNHIKYYL